MPISEEMAEELTPPKEAGSGSETGGSGGVGLGGGESKAGGNRSKAATAEGAREEVLRELAKACKRQGNFHLACKKYTQVGLMFLMGLERRKNASFNIQVVTRHQREKYRHIGLFDRVFVKVECCVLDNRSNAARGDPLFQGSTILRRGARK